MAFVQIRNQVKTEFGLLFTGGDWWQWAYLKKRMGTPAVGLKENHII